MMIDRHEQIFVGFLNRVYCGELTNEQLEFEVNILRTCENRIAYLKARRIGATLVLNRQKRNRIYDLYEKAYNHYTVEIEMMEFKKFN